jgi:hypothetical protein
MKGVSFAALAIILATPASSQQPPGGWNHGCPMDTALSALIADSDYILLGTMRVPLEELQRQAGAERPDYIDIPVDIERTAKGMPVASAVIRFYPVDAWYKPSTSTVAKLSGEPALLFLTQVDDGPAGLYFAGSTPGALRPAGAQTMKAVESEVKRQASVLESWVADPSLPHFPEVQRLIAMLGLVRGDEQRRIFEQLEQLGERAVPAIVANMDDRRPLLDKQISLRNRSPAAFERVRHYRPDLVVDALSAVLNQITDKNFGSIHNGGTERQRTAAVAGWRIYASGLHCARAA